MESEAIKITIVALGSAAAVALGTAWRVRLWRRGQPAKVPLLTGLLALPKRYLVDLHAVVQRDRRMARAHVLAAGGLVSLVMFFSLLLITAGLTIVIAWAVIASSSALLIGAALAARRRWPVPNARLSRGAFDRFPYLLISIGGGSIALALGSLNSRFALISDIGAVCVALGFVQLGYSIAIGGPVKHAVAGALHLAWHPRPERFGAKRPSVGLRRVDLSSARFGIASPADFAWNRLLQFDACVQCGRCEAVCPAFAAGQPLNPKKLIQDLVVGLAGPSTDGAYRGSPHPGKAIGAAFGAPDVRVTPKLIGAETLWSCTTCRACVHECPMMIEHVDTIIDLRRHETMELARTPGQGGIALEQLRQADNPGGAAAIERTRWGADLDIPLVGEVKACEILFWVGDAAFDPASHGALRAFVQLMRQASVHFAYLGNEELDCGDLARRLGDDDTFQSLARRNIEILQKHGVVRIVTPDPHAFNCIRNDYPDLGGVFDVLHHTQFLAELVDADRLMISRRLVGSVTYHDPCYLARYNGEVNAPRRLLDMTGLRRTEMQRSGLQSRCCGGGGGAPLTDVPGKRRIPDMRMDDARETEASIVAVACPNCAVMLKGVVEPRPLVRDIVEILLEASEAGHRTHVPRIPHPSSTPQSVR